MIIKTSIRFLFLKNKKTSCKAIKVHLMSFKKSQVKKM